MPQFSSAMLCCGNTSQKPLTIITRSSILDAAAVLDPPLFLYQRPLSPRERDSRKKPPGWQLLKRVYIKQDEVTKGKKQLC